MENDDKPSYSSCTVIKPQKFQHFKIPATWFSYHTASKYNCSPQFQYFTIHPKRIFWIENPTYFVFFEIVRNYVPIIITIASNIAVLVSYNVAIWLGCFMSMNHCVDKDSSQLPPTTFLSPTRFHQACLLFYKKYFINLVLLWSDYLWKKYVFKVKKSFFQLIACRVWFCCLFTCIFYSIFCSSTKVKLRINYFPFAWRQIWPLIKPCDIKKEFMFWRLEGTFSAKDFLFFCWYLLKPPAVVEPLLIVKRL